MGRKPFVLTMIVFLACCSQAKNSPTIRFPYIWLGDQGFGGNIDQLNLVEPSGLCFHPLRKTLFVVGDEGDIAEMETDGTPVFSLKIEGDLEGITANPESGLLYVVKEGEDIILEFDPERREVTREFPVNREYQGNPYYLQKREGYDNGIESIAFVPDKNHAEGGTFYAGNQYDPPCIMELLVPLKSSRAKTAEAKIIRVLPFKMDDPSAMSYDPETKLLTVVSDADNILVEITLKGKLINQYAFLGDSQEGVAWDEDGYFYIAQDIGGILKVKDRRR